MNIPEKERALVLQGGGSLGAYEAGAYRAIYEFLSKRDADEGKKGRSTFNIVAGTSIGAINAAVLVSYVVENQTYEGSAERLVDFWNYLSKESLVGSSPFFKPWWDYWHAINGEIASGEAARRYYSAQEFAIYGVPNVFCPHFPAHDSRFFDSNNTWYRYNNEPLRRSLERFAKFPIATNQEEDQPRLILVAVDVADGIPVTFDSYPTEDGSRKTGYGRFIDQNGKEFGFEHVVHYDKGITSEHVMASGSFPVNFDFTKIEVESYNSEPASRRLGDAKTSSTANTDGYRKGMRYFWDGGLMTNTPLMQLVLLHRLYWWKVRGLKDKVPGLRICIINLHPTKQAKIPTDRDGVMNRNTDITFSDRTQTEEIMMLAISDYLSLIKKLIKAAKENGLKDEVINDILNQKTQSHGFFSKIHKYSDLIEGRPQIDEILRIDRKNDEHTISNKTFDFSTGTIKLLLERGYDDAKDEINQYVRNHLVT